MSAGGGGEGGGAGVETATGVGTGEAAGWEGAHADNDKMTIARQVKVLFRLILLCVMTSSLVINKEWRDEVHEARLRVPVSDIGIQSVKFLSESEHDKTQMAGGRPNEIDGKEQCMAQQASSAQPRRRLLFPRASLGRRTGSPASPSLLV